MPRSPYVLAALVSAALPGVDPVRTRVIGGADEGRGASDGASGDLVDEAVVEDARGGRWLVRAPRGAAGGVALEQQAAALAALAGAAVPLPFALPRVAGSAALPDGGRALVLSHLPSAPLDVGDLRPGGALTTSLGDALAALHAVPTRVVDDAGLPAYDAEELRQRRLGELDRAAATGLVPSVLLGRWERELEGLSAWRFPTTVVHGSLGAPDVLVDGPGGDAEVAAVTGWGDLQVADPADDVAWLVASAADDAADDVLRAYGAARESRGGARDDHLLARALLSSELALTRWLLHGVASDDATVVADAAAMLRELESQARTEAP